MVSVIHSKVASSYSSGNYDEEIIVEGLGPNTSRVTTLVKEDGLWKVPCMPMKMQISSFDKDKLESNPNEAQEDSERDKE